MNQPTDASALFAPLWKRKWLILLVGLLVAGGTYAYFNRKPSLYQVGTQIYLGAAAEEGLGGGSTKKGSPNSPANAGAIINSPIIHEPVVHRLRTKNTGDARAAENGRYAAGASEKSQFIGIVAEAYSRAGAALLANTVAQTYISRQNENRLRQTERAVSLTRRQLRRVEATLAVATAAKGGKNRGSAGLSTSETLQAANLQTKINQLESQLSASGVKQLGRATPAAATLLSPKPKKNAIFGFFVGIFLAALAVYALTRFDRRLRSLPQIEAAFGTHILTAVPAVRHPIVRREGRLAPSRHISEPVRRLHTTLRLGETLNGHRANPARSILFLSADAGDGKSTIAAALALVQRDAGERVGLIEANFRRPVQATLLEAASPSGLLQVLSGALTWEEGMQPAEAGGAKSSGAAAAAGAGVATMVQARQSGTLSVLVGERGVANPPALLADQAMGAVLRSASDEFDHVTVDAPSPLEVSDAMPLLSEVDGIILVARAGHTREVSAQRLVQLLARTPSAPVLGVVANAVSRTDLERYGFSLGEDQRPWSTRLIGR